MSDCLNSPGLNESQVEIVGKSTPVLQGTSSDRRIEAHIRSTLEATPQKSQEFTNLDRLLSKPGP